MSVDIKDLYGELLNSYINEMKALIEKSNLIIGLLNSEIAKNKIQFLSTQLTRADLSVRSLNCLKAMDISSVYDLVQCDKADILRFRNFGPNSFRDIENFLERHNLHFGMQAIDIINYCNE